MVSAQNFNLNEFILGDCHNFARSVKQISNNRLYKPRAIGWEWLFLGQGPFRKFLTQKFDENHLDNPMEMFPLLNFYSENPDFISGKVEKIIFKNDLTLNVEICSRVGGVIGLLSWFGITDLHSENIVFGRDKSGKPLFGPLDIECIFHDLLLPSQTGLLNIDDSERNTCGLACFIDQLEQQSDQAQLITATISGYLNTLKFLIDIEDDIYIELLKIKNIEKWPIRYVLRDTKEYHNILSGKLKNESVSKLDPTEEEQLRRGDIPYYFRYLFSQDLYWCEYFREEWNKDASNVYVSSKDFPSYQDLKVFDHNKKIKWNNRNQLLFAGSLQLLKHLSKKIETSHNECVSTQYRETETIISSDFFKIKTSNPIVQEWLCKR